MLLGAKWILTEMWGSTAGVSLGVPKRPEKGTMETSQNQGTAKEGL